MRSPTTLDGDADSIFAGEHVSDDGPPVPPEVRLARAVLWQAYADAFVLSDIGIKNTDRRCDPEEVRWQSRRFLTVGFGVWAEDRTFWSDAAGIPEPALRAVCKRRLEEAKRAESENQGAQIIELDTALTRLLDSESTMTAAELDAALAELAALERAA